MNDTQREPRDSLEAGLRQFRRRMLSVGLGGATLWGLAAGAVVLLVCMWLDLVLDLPPAARAACGFAALLCAGILLSRFAWRAWRGSGSTSVARRLDQVAGTRGQILSGVDLMHYGGASGQSSAALSVGMARMAVGRAAELAARVQPAKAAPLSTLYKPYVATGLVAAFVFGVALLSPRLLTTQWNRFADPYGDHPPYSRVNFTVDPAGAKVLYGGALYVRASADGEAIESVELVLSTDGAGGEEALPMFPEPGGAWRATIANVTTPGQYFVRTRGARSKRFELGVITVPKLEEVRWRVTPPAYTNRPPYEGPLPKNGLAGLKGTTVQVWARSNRPLSGGPLEFTPSSAPSTSPSTQPAGFKLNMTPTVSGASEVTGSFVIERPGTLTLRVVDVDGQPSTDSLSASVSLLSDQRPFVRMAEPRPDSFATPDVTIPVEMLAEDDYGVSRVQLYRSLNDSRAKALDVPAPQPAPTRFPAASPLKLGDYGLNPGDVVKLYARVEDNDPAGAKGSESPVVVVRIISQEEMQRMQLAREGMETLQSKYAAAARLMEALDAKMEKLLKELEALEKLDPDSDLAKEKLNEIGKLAEDFKQAANEVSELAKEDLPFDLDKALKGELGKVQELMEQAADGTEALAGQRSIKPGTAKKAMNELRQRLGAQRQEFKEKATDPLDHLAKIFPLMEDEARFVELYQRQRDLEERMKSLQGQDGQDDPKVKARMRDLEEEQRQLREELKGLLDDIESHVQELPEDPRVDQLRETAKKFAEALRQSPAAGQMSEAEQALSEFAGTRAHGGAKDAADTLEKFLGQCKGMGEEGQACLKFQPGLSQGLGNTVQQLLDAMGMGTGQMGQGAGGGYSARRSTLRNVGLYGRLPTRSRESGGGGRSQRGASARDRGEGADEDDPGAYDVKGRLNASGQSDAAVPERYRKRVGDYFQRVADELGEE